MKHISKLFRFLVLTPLIGMASINASAQSHTSVNIDPAWVTEYAPTAANDEQACVAHFSYDVIQTGSPSQLKTHLQKLYDTDNLKNLSVYDQVDLMTRLSNEKIDIDGAIMDRFFQGIKHPPSLDKLWIEKNRKFLDAVTNDPQIPNQKDWQTLLSPKPNQTDAEKDATGKRITVVINRIMMHSAEAYGIDKPSIKLATETKATTHAEYDGSKHRMIVYAGDAGTIDRNGNLVKKGHAVYNINELIITLGHEMHHAYQFKLAFTKIENLPEAWHGISVIYDTLYSNPWFWNKDYETSSERIVRDYELFTETYINDRPNYDRVERLRLNAADTRTLRKDVYQEQLISYHNEGRTISCTMPHVQRLGFR